MGSGGAAPERDTHEEPPRGSGVSVTATPARTSLGLRIVPPALLGARRGQRLVERNLFVYRRTWMILFSGFFEPVFYLASVRLGLGTLVGDVEAGRHEHLMFGEGEVRWTEVAEGLAASGYAGPLEVELSRHSSDAPATARRSLEFLRALLSS